MCYGIRSISIPHYNGLKAVPYLELLMGFWHNERHDCKA